jgi:NADH:ubiquinone oxidoreductase subunit F (NADH-binding)/(2Fe-2S) ferredoxin
MMLSNLPQLAEAARLCRERQRERGRWRVNVSLGTCGIAAGGLPVRDALVRAVEASGRNDVEVVEVGCMGLCHSEPSIEILQVQTQASIFYGPVGPKDVEQIFAALGSHAPGVPAVKKSWYYPETDPAQPGCLQARIVLRNSGRINPESIDEYLAAGGYLALGRTLSDLTPQQTVEIVTASGLRGRGGGGFPTGKKWAICHAQQADTKYLICNADEGDPGAFMDRAVLEGDPHAVLEGMIIGGYATGANAGIIYIRAEYPLAIRRLEIAIDAARQHGLLGTDILGTGFDFDITIRYGAGAFVCGEETALIRSVVGMRGMPVFKPPFPAVAGLWGKPTVVNNVETLANVPPILRQGADWFRSIGTEGSPGTKVFSLTGKINKVGLIEVPMGISLRDIIYGLGEGTKGARALKAVQTGGPSGGCITAASLDSPIDYDSLKALGSMMGSGGMIVLDQDDCMVDVAKFFLEFTMDESCGKCSPCRIGSYQMHAILKRITEGNGAPSDLGVIENLAHTMKTASLCGLGATAPNPVLATLAHFSEEYRAHIVDHRCPVGKCANLVTYSIDGELCTGCTLCARKCPVVCISGKIKEPHEIDASACIRCGVCFDVCKFSAVVKS